MGKISYRYTMAFGYSIKDGDVSATLGMLCFLGVVCHGHGIEGHPRAVRLS